MADSKVSALTTAGAFADADILYIVQGGVSFKTTWGAIKAAILLAKYPEVANFAALPAAAGHTGETYVCLSGQGTYFINRKPAGFYNSNGTVWTFLDDLPSDYFTDSILQIADDVDPTKLVKFQLSSITTATTRTVTMPDKSGTMAMTSDITGTNSGTNTGDQTITLTGDVTGSGTGSFAATIAAAAVTLAKMANMATASVFYRKTAGTGVPEVQTLATLKTDLGLTGTNTGDQTITLTGDVTGSGTGSFAASIAAGAVTLAQMANMATASVFYRKTAAAGAPEVQTLATLKTDLGLTGTNGGDQTITLTGDVTGSGTGSFAATIAANAVTLAKMAQISTLNFLGRLTASTGNVESLSAAQMWQALNVATNAISASAIDWSLARTHSKTLGANTTFTFSNATDGQTIVVALTNTASNWTVTWPTVSWSGGSTPVQTVGAKTDVYTFAKIGSTIYGSAVQNF